MNIVARYIPLGAHITVEKDSVLHACGLVGPQDVEALSMTLVTLVCQPPPPRFFWQRQKPRFTVASGPALKFHAGEERGAPHLMGLLTSMRLPAGSTLHAVGESLPAPWSSGRFNPASYGFAVRLGEVAPCRN